MSQPGPSTHVVDASVVMKWFLPDEVFAQEALAVLFALQDGEPSLVAPNHLYYEVANVLRTSVIRSRLTDEEARHSLVACLALPVITYGNRDLVLRGFDMAQRFGCAAYDGLYLAAADELGCPLIHADRRLRDTLSGAFERELWIQSFERSGAT